MSLVTQLTDLVTRIGTEFKSVRTSIGSLASLSTTAKDNLVNAINEVATAVGGAGATIDDTGPSTIKVYSSSKTESVATSKATTAAGALINDTTASGSSVYSSNKTVAVAAAAASTAAGALIVDGSLSTTKVYSSQKTSDAIGAAVAALVASSPTTLDTLNEIATALGNDPNFATTMTAALGNRLRFDAAQTLTAPQKVQGNTNLGSLSLLQAGDPTTDFVAAFNTAIA